jgi:hypothetical protein
MSGTISQLNYNPDGDIEGFVVNGSTLVHLPPPMLRAAEGLHKGDGIEVQGLEHSSGAGLSVLEAQSIQDRTSNKKLALPSPGGPAPYTSSGKVQQLNYGPDGAINGFLLDNGTLATMPPFSASQPSAVRVGSSVSVAGTARATMSGRTVVDVQTITVNPSPSIDRLPRLGLRQHPLCAPDLLCSAGSSHWCWFFHLLRLRPRLLLQVRRPLTPIRPNHPKTSGASWGSLSRSTPPHSALFG